MVSCICRGDVLDGLGWYRIVIRKHWEWIRRFDRYTGYKWVIILKAPFPSLCYSFFSLLRPKTKSIFNLTRQGNDCGLVWGLWVTILKNLFSTIMFPLHSQSYSIINLVLGHYTEFFTTGLLGMIGDWAIFYVLSPVRVIISTFLFSFRHYIDLLFHYSDPFGSLYWKILE